MINIERIFKFDAALIKELFNNINRSSSPNKRFFESDKNIFLTASEGNRYVGFLYAYILESPEIEQPRAFLYSIDIFGGFRRQKFGSALMEELKKICRVANCMKIFVITEPQNKPAMEFYRYHNGILENEEEAMFVFDL